MEMTVQVEPRCPEEEARKTQEKSWEPRRDKGRIWSAPRPSLAAWPPEDSLPPGQPEPAWMEDPADISLPALGAAEAGGTSGPFRDAVLLMMRAQRAFEESEAATRAARARAAALEAELASARERALHASLKVSSRSGEQALEADLAAERRARAAIVADLEIARATIRELKSEGGPEPESAELLAENAELKARLRELERQVDSQRQTIADQEMGLREGSAREKRRQLSQRARSLTKQVTSAVFHYLPVEFLSADYTEAQRELLTVAERLPEDTSVAQLKSHVTAMAGKADTFLLQIVYQEDLEFVSLQDSELIPESSRGIREFFLQGLAKADLQCWTEKMEARAERLSPTSRTKEASSPSLSQKRRRQSRSLWEACRDPPVSQKLSAVAAGGDCEGDEGQVLDKAPLSVSAPSAAAAVSRVMHPSLPDFEAITQAPPLRRAPEAPSGHMPAADAQGPALPPSVPGLRIYDRRPKRPRPPELQRKASEPLQAPVLQRKNSEPLPQSAPALERCFSRSPSWHAFSSSERKARRQQRLAAGSSEAGPPVREASPEPLVPIEPAAAVPMGPPAAPMRSLAVPMGPPAVRASGLHAVEAVAAANAELCRCVVRGKQARLALMSFDCEQCRAFYDATGATGNCKPGAASATRAWRAGTGHTRHRFEQAPTNTPDGFWDLSFPHEVA